MTDPLGHLAAHDLLAGVDNQSRLVSELDRQLNYSARHSRVAPAVNGPARLDANPYTAKIQVADQRMRAVQIRGEQFQPRMKPRHHPSVTK
jgi:hypothetical protein